MPELPDVDIYRRYLNATSLHQRIKQVSVTNPAILSRTSPQGLGRTLKGKAFGSSRRHGKYLFIDIKNGDWLLMHFGMTGFLEYSKNSNDIPKHTQALFCFENGYHLAYVAQRRLGKIAVIANPEDYLQEHEIGPDARDVTEKDFLRLADNYGGSIKSLLMNQKLLSGIGNIYSDEILFQAVVHPKCNAGELDETTLKRLYRSMHHVLQKAIDAQADVAGMPSSFILPHRARGKRCPRCNTPLESIKVSGRTAWYCPHCQKA